MAVGDEVEALVDLASRPARGKTTRLLSAGEGRVAPSCAYVEACGACDWMHLSREVQRSTREDHLRRALPASMRDLPILLHDTGASLGYRTRARLHIRASGGRAIVGPHGVGSHDIVDIAACVVLDPRLDAALAPLASLLEGAHGTGEAHIALGRGGRPVVELRWDGVLPPACFGRMEKAVTAGVFAGGTLYEGDTPKPAVIGDPTPEMMGADGAVLRLSSGGFAQASDAGNVELGERVLALAKRGAGSKPSASVVELYAGAGNFTVLLARAFERVLAVESSAAACDAARANLGARGLVAKVTCADADAFVFTGSSKTDVVVLDPPRRGARKACAAIAVSSVKAVVYVSCDAPTLGRDLAVLAERFDVAAIESFAMFAGTSHSESVVLLCRKPR